MAANRRLLIGAIGAALGLVVGAVSLLALSGDDDVTATDASTTSWSTTAPIDDGVPSEAGAASSSPSTTTDGASGSDRPGQAAADGADPADGGADTADADGDAGSASAGATIDPGDAPEAPGNAGEGATTTITAGATTAPVAPSGDSPAGFTAGIATYYDATGAGACMFDPSPGDLRVAALNAPQFGTADLCGAWVEVNGPNGSITVRIVDLCPECESGHLDLSEQAFAAIGNPVDGIIPIEWRVVEAAVSGPIAFRFKEGSSQYWTAVQVRNHRHPVATLEYQLA
ncbi:MAG: expansin EXLX1 family cellulose-binding protein, partial [Actinomycetota bacterium]